MIQLVPKKGAPVHFLGVLESRLDAYLALGWEETHREKRPSVDELIVLLAWRGDGKPPLPVGHGEPR